MSEEDDVELWRRARRSVKLVGAVAVACVLVLLTVPVAVALEDTTTSTTDSLTEDDPLEPSEDTSTLEEDDGTIDETLDTVDGTDDTGTLEPVTDTTREVLLEPEEEPSDGDGQTDDPDTTDDGEQEEGDGDAAATTGDDGEQTGDEGSDPAADAQSSGALSAEPAADDGRRPFAAASAGGPGAGPDPQMLAKLTEPGERWGGQNQGFMDPPPSLAVSPYAADVVVPLGPRSTRDILDLLGGDAAMFGEVARILAPFPVAGPAQYGDDYGAPRHEPSPHPHAGTDVFAPRGTPVIASADGTIGALAADTAIGGNSLKVFAPDGSYFYYAHLDGFAPGIANGTSVELGQVIGYVGDTGNALGTPPHLHYEIHPGGGAPVNPVPYLDRWLANARAAAQSLADANQGVWAPQVAPPADASAEVNVEAQQQAGVPASPQVTTPAQPAQDLIGAESDTSPMSLLILIGAAGTLFLMMRRPETTGPTASPAPSANATPAASLPSTRPEVALELLPMPGDPVEVEEDEFEWVTLGA